MADHSHPDDQRPRSFHASPAEALGAPPERFLYLACLHEGTGVAAPDFLAVARGLGCDAVHVAAAEELEAALEGAFAATHPTLVHVRDDS